MDQEQQQGQGIQSERDTLFMFVETLKACTEVYFRNVDNHEYKMFKIAIGDRITYLSPERFLRAFASEQFMTIQEMIAEAKVHG